MKSDIGVDPGIWIRDLIPRIWIWDHKRSWIRPKRFVERSTGIMDPSMNFLERSSGITDPNIIFYRKSYWSHRFKREGNKHIQLKKHQNAP